MTAFVAVACGSSHPPAGNSASGGPPVTGDGGVSLPGCGAQENGGYCDCVDAPLFYDPPNIYFVFDRSRSMAEANKWTNMQSAAKSVVHDVASRSNFGAFVFPGGDGTNCNPGEEIMPMRAGDPPNSQFGATLAALGIALAKLKPSGGTPTAAALQKAYGSLAAVSGRRFVILATDGGPNCNAAAGCDASLCMANIENQPDCPPNGPPNCCAPPNGIPDTCLDSKPTIDAVAALAAAGIPTYVVGPSGIPIYASLLDQLAATGGTEKYYSVNAADQTALAATLKRVAAKIVATCTFKLKEEHLEQDTVNVYFDEKLVPQDPANGWTISGDTVTLTGAACAAVMNGDILDVRVIVGCPTVLH